jgi:excisionase family DNA binding protein
MVQLLTPRQVADSLGVSESSLKRWCDNGDLEVTRTPGGHRRLSLAGVMQFLRESSRELVNPEAIGLPKHIGVQRLSSENHALDFFDAILADDFYLAKRIVLDMYLRGKSLAQVLDEIVAASLHRVGDEWVCEHVEVHQEHRACEIVFRVICDLRGLLKVPDQTAPLAVGAACEGDFYTLPTLMVESVLTEMGWRATSLGCNLPLESLLKVTQQDRPKLVWLSASDLKNPLEFIASYHEFYDRLPAGVSVVVGGRALTSELRAEMRYASHCENLQQLVEFANAVEPQQA